MNRPGPDDFRHARRTDEIAMCGVLLHEGSYKLSLSASREVFEAYLMPAEAAGFIMPELCTGCMDAIRRERGHEVASSDDAFGRIVRSLMHGAFLSACVDELLEDTGRKLGVWQISTLRIDQTRFGPIMGWACLPRRDYVAEIAHPPDLVEAGHRMWFVVLRLFEAADAA